MSILFSGPAPRKCILPGLSKMKEQSLPSLEVNTIGDTSSETLMVPEGGKNYTRVILLIQFIIKFALYYYVKLS